MKTLTFFRSVEVPDEVYDAFQSMENLLQREHSSDGSHPVASQGVSGFMSADDHAKLDKLWEWFEKNKS